MKKTNFKPIYILGTICCILSLIGCVPSAEYLPSLYKKASDNYQRLIEKNPQDVALQQKCAKFYYSFRDYEKAKNILENIGSQEAKIILAKVLVKLKDYNSAIEIFEKLKPLPNDQEYRYLYGQVLEEKNLFPKALKIYKKVEGSYKALAQERISFIKGKVEDGIPREIQKILKKAKKFIKQAKDDAAIYLLVDEKMQINENNTSLSTVHVIEKVLKERGKTLAEVEMGYDSTYERVELDFARTITEDGKVIYAGKGNIRDIGRYLNYPLYSNARAFIVSMPSVDVGSIIEYKIKIYSSKLVNEKDFTTIYRIRERYPIFRAIFKLIMPKERKINYKFLNQEYAKGINLEPKHIEEGDKRIYTWQFFRIEPIVPEYSMPPASLINPAILISSFSSWDEIYKWWKSLYQDKMELTEEIKDFIKDITKGAQNNLDKAKKIHEYVAKNIRYVAIEYGDSGHEPHHAGEVFMNRYGDCKDQAILLVAMLKEAGLKAYPVLIPTRRSYKIFKDFPSLNFNHAISAVEIGNDLILMDPTAETVPFKELPLSDQGRPVLVFLDDNSKIINTIQSKENQVQYNMDISINSQENAQLTRSIQTQGFFASSYRGYLKYTHPAIIEEDIREKMTKISSLSKLIDYEIKNPDDFDATPQLTYRFETEKFLNPAANLRIVPVLDELNLDYSLIGKESRNFPIDLDGLYTKAAKIRINLPENLIVKYLPRSKTLENDWFKVNVSYKENAGHIAFGQKFITKKRFVTQGEYREFKKHLKDAIYLLREEIILEKQ